MGQIIAAIVPVVLTIAAGVWARRRGIVDADGAKRINALVYWICFPAFLVWKFGSPTDAGAGPDWPWRAIVGESVAVLVMVVAIMILGRGLGPARQGSVISIAFRSNGAFVGLPIAALLVAEGVLAPQGVANYLLLLAVIMPLFNIVSVIGFVTPHHGLKPASLLPVLKGLITNPILWGCGIGLAVAQLPSTWQLDGWVASTLRLIGQPAVPLALLAAGATLEFRDLRNVPAAAWVGAIGKLVLMPALALGIAVLLGAGQAELAVLAVLAVSPSAVAAVPMAAELGGDVRLSASGVVLTTLLAPISVVAWLSVLLT